MAYWSQVHRECSRYRSGAFPTPELPQDAADSPGRSSAGRSDSDEWDAREEEPTDGEDRTSAKSEAQGEGPSKKTATESTADCEMKACQRRTKIKREEREDEDVERG